MVVLTRRQRQQIPDTHDIPIASLESPGPQTEALARQKEANVDMTLEQRRPLSLSNHFQSPCPGPSALINRAPSFNKAWENSNLSFRDLRTRGCVCVSLSLSCVFMYACMYV